MARVVIAVLVALLFGLQYRLWFGDGGVHEILRLRNAITAQQLEIERFRERNLALDAEVRDLKSGTAAIEELCGGRTCLFYGYASPTMTIWAVVPAAGRGSRMGTALPKPYLGLCGRTVIEHTLAALESHPAIARIIVALAAADDYWDTLPVARNPRIVTVQGGEERCHSKRCRRGSSWWFAGLSGCRYRKTRRRT